MFGKELGWFMLLFIFDLIAEPDVLKEVKMKLDLGSVKFEVVYVLYIILKYGSWFTCYADI